MKTFLILTTIVINHTFNNNYQFDKLFTVTAYCKNSCCCGNFSDGYTSSGYRIVGNDKICAAGKSIPFGSKIAIPKLGLVTVEDRGEKIKDDCIDILFPTHREALEWGRQKLKCRVYIKE